MLGTGEEEEGAPDSSSQAKFVLVSQLAGRIESRHGVLPICYAMHGPTRGGFQAARLLSLPIFWGFDKPAFSPH